MPASPAPRLRPDRTDRKAGRDQKQATDVATVEQTRRVFEAAAEVAAKLQDGVRERAVAHGSRPQPARQRRRRCTQQPDLPPTPGRNTPTGGVA
ncbi:hypothetical protein [Streptomyces sp. NPDC055287]